MAQELQTQTAPLAIAAFEGWNDAGDAASDALLFFKEEWQAVKVATISAEEYVDYSVNRPTIKRTGDEPTLNWPDTTIWRAELPELSHEVYLVHGIEPSLRWRHYCQELIEALTDRGVENLIGMGALLADVPHTRQIPIHLSSNDPQIQFDLGVQPSEYEGPTGILGTLIHVAHHRGLTTLSTWAAVPHYVSSSPSPKAMLALVNKISELLGVAPQIDELTEDAQAWQRGVEELAEQDSEIAAYVRALEDAQDTAELPEASGEAIAQEFERYLRRRPRPDDRPRPEDWPGN